MLRHVAQFRQLATIFDAVEKVSKSTGLAEGELFALVLLAREGISAVPKKRAPMFPVTRRSEPTEIVLRQPVPLIEAPRPVKIAV